MKERKVKFFLAGAFLSALAITSVTPLMGLGVAATAIDVAASIVGGAVAVSQA